MVLSAGIKVRVGTFKLESACWRDVKGRGSAINGAHIRVKVE